MIRLATLACVAALVAWADAAHAGLLVAPTRLVFEGGRRSGEFVLVNNGSETQRYRINLVDRRMNEQGRLEPVAELGPDELSARELLRFSPRQVELRPREPQTIRVLVRKPGDLERGEYRAHLQFQQVPEPEAPAAPDAGGPRFGVRLRPIFGIAVPVIVRHGTLTALARLERVRIERGADDTVSLALEIHRDGERSTYGNVVAHWLPEGGSAVEVGRTNGVALYTPNEMRPFSQPLRFPGAAFPASGRLKVRYLEPESAGSGLIAEAGLDLSTP